MIDNTIHVLRALKKEGEKSKEKCVVFPLSDISYLLNFAESVKKEMEREKEISRTVSIQNAANETKVQILEKEIETLRDELKQAGTFHDVAIRKLDEFNFALEKSRKENENLKNRILNSNHIDRDYAIKQIDNLIKKAERSTETWFFERLKEFILVLPSAKDLRESVRCTNCEYYHPFSNETRCMYRELCCPQNPEGSVSRSVRWCYTPKRGLEDHN